MQSGRHILVSPAAIWTDKSVSGAGSMEILAGSVPARSDHSQRCGNAVCIPGTAPSFAQSVPQKELNLLQFTTSLMAKTGASPAKVVRGERRNLTVLCFLLYNTPNNLGAESGSPNPASLVDRTKERTGRNLRGYHPGVNSSLHPIWDRDGSYVATLADKIGYDPVLLPLL
jgi:hypothetical protein